MTERSLKQSEAPVQKRLRCACCGERIRTADVAARVHGRTRVSVWCLRCWDHEQLHNVPEAAPLMVQHYVPISDHLRADFDPEYAASAEYLEKYPPPPPQPWWHRARQAIPRIAARPFWLLGTGLGSLGYAIANAAAWLFRVNVHYEKPSEDEDD